MLILWFQAAQPADVLYQCLASA